MVRLSTAAAHHPDERGRPAFLPPARGQDARFFLAVDYYRLLKNVKDGETARRYERLSREALDTVVRQYPGTMEARAAEALLEGLKAGRGN